MNDILLASRPAVDLPLELAGKRTDLFVTFKIAYQHCALPLGVTLEVVRLPALVELAGAPPMLCGLLNLRGQYLPILDARLLIGAPAVYDLNSQIVIAGRGKPELGLLVDEVHDICMVAAERVAPINRTDVAPFLTNVFDLGEESVLVFDVAALLAYTPEKVQLKAKKRSKRASRTS
jgi:purine-binding chemotaxis protein CheW